MLTVRLKKNLAYNKQFCSKSQAGVLSKIVSAI